MKTTDKLLKMIPKRGSYRMDTVYFLENSDHLHIDGSAEKFREFLIENKIKHTVNNRLSEMDYSQLTERVKDGLNNFLVFETTGTTKTFEVLKDIIIKLSNDGYHFKIIECFINEPVFYAIPKEAHKSLQMWTLDCYSEDRNDWELIKLKRRK